MKEENILNAVLLTGYGRKGRDKPLLKNVLISCKQTVTYFLAGVKSIDCTLYLRHGCREAIKRYQTMQTSFEDGIREVLTCEFTISRSSTTFETLKKERAISFLQMSRDLLTITK